MKRTVYPYVIATSLLGVALLVLAPWGRVGPDSLFWNSLAAFALLAFAAEAAFLKLPIGSATSSVAFIPYLASIVLLGPGWTMVIAGSIEVIVETVIRKKPGIKVVFNTSNQVLATGLAGGVYAMLGGTWSLIEFRLAVPAFLAAAAAYFFVNTGGTVVAIVLSSGSGLRATWQRLVGGSLLFDFLASPLALLLAFLYTRAQLVGILVVGVPLFLVRHIYSMNLKLEEVNRDLLELMVKAIEARDPYTSGHSLRVSRLAGQLARDLGLSSRQVEQIETGALLHDVGKIHEEYAPILRKNGQLSKQEMALMKTHAIRSYELVRTISRFRGNVDLVVRHHHENYDGGGYPDGLKGEDIPLGARIIMVADTVDAMTTDRPYRGALSLERVSEELGRFAGKQFDPQVVRAFERSTMAQDIAAAKPTFQGEPSAHHDLESAPVVRLAVR